MSCKTSLTLTKLEWRSESRLQLRLSASVAAMAPPDPPLPSLATYPFFAPFTTWANPLLSFVSLSDLLPRKIKQVWFRLNTPNACWAYIFTSFYQFFLCFHFFSWSLEKMNFRLTKNSSFICIKKKHKYSKIWKYENTPKRKACNGRLRRVFKVWARSSHQWVEFVFYVLIFLHWRMLWPYLLIPLTWWIFVFYFSMLRGPAI